MKNANVLHDPVCGMDLPANRVFLTEFTEDVFCRANYQRAFEQI